jgi:hypothetical protein
MTVRITLLVLAIVTELARVSVEIWNAVTGTIRAVSKRHIELRQDGHA